jgi:hypothetical protein
MRLRINQTLTTLRKLDYTVPAKDDALANWLPSPQDSPELIEMQITRYFAWWANPQNTKQP